MADFINVAVDAMGGDNAPVEIVKGVVDAVHANDHVKVYLTGQEELVRKELEKYTYPADRIEVVNATEVIETAEPPVMAIRRKKDSSIVKALNLVKDGTCDAFVSAGSTGAVLVGGQLVVGRIKGVERSPLATLFPTEKGVSLLVDCGANVDVRSSHLVQFAKMGSVYMEHFVGVSNPKVAIVNNGAEETKGTPIYREAHQLLKANPCLHFAGNIEPRYIMDGEVDVVVCDGFVGNVVLKLTEGVAKTLLGMLKKIFLQNLITKLSYLGIKGGLGELKRMMDSEEVGGAPLLGAAKPVIKAHGSSHAKGIKNAIRQAKLCVANDLCGTMQTALAAVAEKAEAEKAEPVKE